MANRAAEPVLLGFLRHGEVAGAAHVYRGRSDASLTPHGLRQMHHALAALPHWGAVVSSPARRCLDFARAIAAERRIDCTVDSDWHELDFGAWENLCPGEAAMRDADAHAAFVRDPRHHPLAQLPPFAAWHWRHWKRAKGFKTLKAWRSFLMSFAIKPWIPKTTSTQKLKAWVAITKTWHLAAGVMHSAKPVWLTAGRLNHERKPNNQPRARSPV